MTVKPLTDATVRNLKPPRPGDSPSQRVYLDNLERGLSLVLVVSYGGTKTFRALTYINGKARTRKLGTYPQMKVKEARAAARAYWENPQKFAAQAAVGSFKEIADNWIKRHVEASALRSAHEIKRQLDKYVYPKWKDRPFLEIRRRDVTELLEHIADHHSRSQADAVLATIRGVMTWHQSRDDDYISPIVKGMKLDKRKPKERQRKRILNDDEIRAVWAATDDMPVFGPLVRLALLTGQRREKVATMQWDDLKDGVWTIAAEEREKGTAGTLKLPKLALDIIAAQPRIAHNPHVFAGSARGRRRNPTVRPAGPPAFNSFSQRKQELDEKLPKMPPWVLHDLRRTARSLMSRAGVRPDIAERVLGHAIPGVEGVYDRFHYDDEKADALRRLAHLIETIINPPKGNVVTMTRTRG
jgi:integrase